MVINPARFIGKEITYRYNFQNAKKATIVKIEKLIRGDGSMFDQAVLDNGDSVHVHDLVFRASSIV